MCNSADLYAGVYADSDMLGCGGLGWWIWQMGQTGYPIDCARNPVAL